jgi:hypothetical protein
MLFTEDKIFLLRRTESMSAFLRSGSAFGIIVPKDVLKYVVGDDDMWEGHPVLHVMKVEEREEKVCRCGKPYATYYQTVEYFVLLGGAELGADVPIQIELVQELIEKVKLLGVSNPVVSLANIEDGRIVVH